MHRLSEATLHHASPGVARPNYQRSDLPVRIVHLGAGAFHRSHQAVYTDDLMQNGRHRWGILAASLRHPGTSRVLSAQDGLYTLLIRGPRETSARIIGSLRQVLWLDESRHTLLQHLHSPQTQIVSLTITEKGYCHEPATGELDESLPEIQADLARPWKARTAIGLLAQAIFERKLHRRRPFTLMSCDDLPSNGKLLQRVLARYLELAQYSFEDPDLLRYFLDQYACPCTVVDRITPPALPADLEEAAALTGLIDEAPVVAEPYRQWVIQDWFSSARPPWEDVGAIMTDHVDRHESVKLRLHNASYTAIAYLGRLAGFETVAQAVNNAAMRRFILALTAAAAQTMHLPRHMTLPEYQGELLQRLGNEGLTHMTAHIVRDGSQKMPWRILEPLRIRLAQGLPVEHHTLVVAAWIAWLMHEANPATPERINDPMAPELTAALRKAGTDIRASVLAVTGFHEIFGRDLSGNPMLQEALCHMVRRIVTEGALAVLEQGADVDHDPEISVIH